jgi:hypothetical protein
MSKQKDSGLMEMYYLITTKGLTPNQFYLMFSMQENVQSLYINVEQELRTLVADEWVTKDNKLTPKAVTLIQQIEGFFRVQKKKTGVQLMGDDFNVNIGKYQLLFPKKKLPSGKAARSAQSNVETNFRWFFENNKFTWETILKATAMYVDEYERKTPPFMYMRTSAYFIRKTELDKSIVSDLANYCEIVESGEDLTSEDTHFRDKVV